MKTKLYLEQESYEIIGAALEVYKELGSGFLEAVYQEAISIEFLQRNIPFEREKMLRIAYKDIKLNQAYKADLICFDQIIVELKSVSVITPFHRAQLHNYLKATNLKLGLLINFGSEKLSFERIVN